MLKQRVVTAVLLLCFFLAALVWAPPAGWLILVALIAAIAGWEWGGLVRLPVSSRRLFSLFMMFGCAGLGTAAGLAHSGSPQTALLIVAYCVSALFWLGVAPLWLRYRWKLVSPALALTIGVIIILPTALALAHLRQTGPLLLLFGMAIVWIADIAAYFTGRRFGRHKLAPSISPGKTWEGAAGAVLAVVIFGLSVVAVSGQGPGGVWAWLYIILAFMVLTSISIAGDLFESLMKRQAGVKDSGSILPGHGGILDRIDSLTSTLPLFGLMAIWV